MKWSEPNGVYDKINLNCFLGQDPIKSIYINTTSGMCISQKTLGGQEISVFTKVEKSNIEYVSSNIFNYIVCKLKLSFYYLS